MASPLLRCALAALGSAAVALGAATSGGPEPLRIEGLVAAVLSPYDDDGGIRLEAVPAIAEYQKRLGVKGVFVGGTTGNSLSMTVSERKALTEAWAPAAKANGLTMIVHVGAEALGDALELAEHAEAHGAAAIGAMPSVFFKPATVEVAALWLQRIGAKAPNLPLYYYHIPSMTGVSFLMLDLIKAVEKVGIPQFAGVKYTGLYETRSFMDFEKCMAYNGGRYEVLCGREEMSVEALAVGAKGFIGSQFNFAGDVYNEIARGWRGSNFTRAREVQSLAQDLLTAWLGVAPAGVDGSRMVMRYAGVPLGPDRLPNLSPDAATVKAMEAALGAWCVSATAVLGWSPRLCVSHPAAAEAGAVLV